MNGLAGVQIAVPRWAQAEIAGFSAPAEFRSMSLPTPLSPGLRLEPAAGAERGLHRLSQNPDAAERLLESVIRALELAGVTAWVCAIDGTLVSMTAAARQVLASESALCRNTCRLAPADPAEELTWLQALHASLSVGAGGVLVLRLGNDAESWRLRLQTLLAPDASVGEASGLVLVHGSRAGKTGLGTPSIAEALHLTPAETEIALGLLDGLPVPAMARRRKVSVHTVRNQVRALMEKLGVRGREALIARLARLHFAT